MQHRGKRHCEAGLECGGIGWQAGIEAQVSQIHVQRQLCFVSLLSQSCRDRDCDTPPLSHRTGTVVARWATTAGVATGCVAAIHQWIAYR